MGLTKRRSAFLVLALLLITALVVVAGCSGGDNGASSELKYNFKAGDSFTYDMKMIMNGTVNAPGLGTEDGQILQDSSVDVRLSMNVIEVADGIASITYKYEKMTMTSEEGTQEVPVSTMPEVTVKIDQYGHVQSVEGGETGALSSLFGAGGGGLPIDYSQISGSTVVPLPEEGAEVGDEWTKTIEQTIPGFGQKVQATTTAKLTALEKVDGDDIATIDFTTDIPMDLTIDLGSLLSQFGQSTTESTDIKFTMSMKGQESFSGTSKVNLSKGLPAEFSGEAVVTLSISITEAPEAMVPADQRGPFDIDMTMDVTLTQVE